MEQKTKEELDKVSELVSSIIFDKFGLFKITFAEIE